MPSPMFDNKWLDDRERKRRLSINLEKPKAPSPSPYDEEPSADQLLAEAKATLAHPNPTYSNEGLTEADRRIAGNRELMRREAAAKPTTFADVTRGMSHAGDIANVGAAGALPLALMPGGAAAPAALGALGGLLQTPDYIRRRFAPEQGEDAGVLEGLLTAANIMPGLGVGKALSAGAEAGPEIASNPSLRRTFGAHVSSEIPYRASSAQIGARIPTNLQREGKPMQDLLDRVLHKGVGMDPPNLHRTGTFDDVSERVLGQPSNIDRTRTYSDLNDRALGGGVSVEQPPATLVPKGQNPAFDRFAAPEAPPPDLMDDFLAGQKTGKESFEMGGMQFAPNEIGSHVRVNRPSLDWLKQTEGLGRMNPPSRAEVSLRFPNSDPDAYEALGSLKHRHEGYHPPTPAPAAPPAPRPDDVMHGLLASQGKDVDLTQELAKLSTKAKAKGKPPVRGIPTAWKPFLRGAE